VDGIIALFAGDAWLTMPPAPLEYQGRELIARFLKTIAFRDGRTYDLVPTRANGQLAFGAYLREAREQDAQANGLLVLTLRGSRIEAMTRFMNSVLPRFGLLPSYQGGRCLSGRRDAQRAGHGRMRVEVPARRPEPAA